MKPSKNTKPGKTLLFILLLIPLLTAPISCGSSEEKQIPANIIPPDSMVSVLVDMYISESMLANLHSRFDSVHYYRREQLDAVMAGHNISRERFDSSYHYYENDLETLQEIQDKVLIELNKRKDKIRREPRKD